MGLFDFLKPKPPPGPFDIALDIARTFGASEEALEQLEGYRTRLPDFYKDHDAYDGQFGVAFYRLLNEDRLVYFAGPKMYAGDVPSNFLPVIERFGYRWEPKDLDHEALRHRWTLTGPDGKAVEAELDTPDGLYDTEADDVVDALVALVNRTSLGAYEIPVQSEQRWFLITRKASFEGLRSKYGPRWKTFFSAE